MKEFVVTPNETLLSSLKYQETLLVVSQMRAFFLETLLIHWVKWRISHSHGFICRVEFTEMFESVGLEHLSE